MKFDSDSFPVSLSLIVMGIVAIKCIRYAIKRKLDKVRDTATEKRMEYRLILLRVAGLILLGFGVFITIVYCQNSLHGFNSMVIFNLDLAMLLAVVVGIMLAVLYTGLQRAFYYSYRKMLRYVIDKSPANDVNEQFFEWVLWRTQFDLKQVIIRVVLWGLVAVSVVLSYRLYLLENGWQ